MASGGQYVMGRERDYFIISYTERIFMELKSGPCN